MAGWMRLTKRGERCSCAAMRLPLALSYHYRFLCSIVASHPFLTAQKAYSDTG